MQFDNATEALADAWASIDGKLDDFRAGKGLSILDQPGGRYAGYIEDATSLIERLRKRGYVIVAADAVPGYSREDWPSTSPAGSPPSSGDRMVPDPSGGQAPRCRLKISGALTP